MKHIRGLAAAAAVAVLITMAGGTAFAKPLSESQWKKRANAVCTQVNKDIDQLTSEVFPSVDERNNASPEQVSAWVERFAPIVRDAIAAIDGLREPKSLQRSVKKFKVAISEAVAEIEHDPVQAFNYEHDPFAKPNKIAKKLGLKACADG